MESEMHFVHSNRDSDQPDALSGSNSSIPTYRRGRSISSAQQRITEFSLKSKMGALFLSILLGPLSLYPNTALAWGCEAAATQGNATGESSHLKSLEEARKAAMDECSIKTDEICEIVECDYDK